ncbi:MAG: tRNA (N(6)-L-threonylcarbamoyladenosine(37)-C(2))-methylthiotransferase MtaB [Desulfobacterales bacterium]
MPLFYITTLGCKVNQCESQALAQELIQAGYRPTADPRQAEVMIVNTCTVTSRAAMQSRQTVRRLLRAQPRAKVAVTGCSVQTDPDRFRTIPGVTHLAGNADKGSLPRILEGSQPPAAIGEFPRALPGFSPKPLAGPAAALSTGSPGRTRAFFKIQDGCNAFCTYCIVPHARGPSRSLRLEDVMVGLQRYGQAGFKEVVLTGIHLGQWGRDLAPPQEIEALLDAVRQARPVARVRLSSMEPNEVSDGLIRRVAAWPGFAPHFHIPLQSGADGVLRRMGRPYTRDQFARRIEAVHHALPEAGIGVDVMVGFPGEDDHAFQQSYDLILVLPITYLHVFPFSPRPGTPAHGFKDQVPAQVSKARAARLRRLGRAKQRDFLKTFLDRTVEVLVTGPSGPSNGILEGLSANYAKIRFPGHSRLRNQFLEVKVRELDAEGRLRGEIVSKVSSQNDCETGFCGS